MSAIGRLLKPPMAGPLNAPRGAWVRSLCIGGLVVDLGDRQVVLAQNASCAAASAYPPASGTARPGLDDADVLGHAVRQAHDLVERAVVGGVQRPRGAVRGDARRAGGGVDVARAPGSGRLRRGRRRGRGEHHANRHPRGEGKASAPDGDSQHNEELLCSRGATRPRSGPMVRSFGWCPRTCRQRKNPRAAHADMTRSAHRRASATRAALLVPSLALRPRRPARTVLADPDASNTQPRLARQPDPTIGCNNSNPHGAGCAADTTVGDPAAVPAQQGVE